MKKYVNYLKIAMVIMLFTLLQNTVVYGNYYDPDFSTEQKLQLEETKNITFDNSKEKQWVLYSFTTTNRDSFYRISLTATSKNGTYMELYEGNDASKLKERYYSGSTTDYKYQLIEKFEKNKKYYLYLYSDTHFQEETVATSTLLVEEVVDDAGDTFETAKLLTKNKETKAVFQKRMEYDYFKFKTGSKKTSYNFSFYNPKDTVLLVHVYDKNKKEVFFQEMFNQGTRYINLNLKKNRVYYISIYASNYFDPNEKLDYKIGVYESSKSIKKDKPKVVKLKTGSGKVNMTWKESNRYDGVEIYRSTYKKSGYKKIDKVLLLQWSTDVAYHEYTDEKVKKGQTYYYKIRFYEKEGKKTYYSKWSSVKKIKVK